MQSTVKGERHVMGLDALRGAAALAVVGHHFASFFVELVKPTGVILVPLNTLRAFGHPAVILFFVLSGFVLSLAFSKSKDRDYRPYLIKRTFRIYPAYLAAMALSMLALAIVIPASTDSLGPYLQNGQPILPDFWSLIRSASLIFAFHHDDKLNIVMWSLVHEMRFSILFPAMFFLCNRWPIVFASATALLYGSANLALRGLGYHPDFFLGDTFLVSLLITLFYLPCFAIGMLLARWSLRRELPEVNLIAELIIILFALLAFRLNIDDGVTALASGLLIIVALKDTRLGWFLKLRAMTFIGKISYSLYLVHFLILFYISVYAWQGDALSLALALAAGIVLSLALATVLQISVERPLQLAGAYLAQKRPILSPSQL